MKKKDNRRVFERIKNDAPIVFAYHNTDQFYPAVMCDYSMDGMCFITPDGVDPGSDIYIMMENYAPDSIHAELYEGFFAEVKWCHPISAGERPEYRVGVKYYKTTIN
jgi:hypothetical protein